MEELTVFEMLTIHKLLMLGLWIMFIGLLYIGEKSRTRMFQYEINVSVTFEAVRSMFSLKKQI